MADRPDALVRVTCDRCGTVELPASEVRLVMARPDATADQPQDQVEFRCRTCGLAGSTRVDERAARLVARAGAALAAPRARAVPPGFDPRRG